jgi:hypothetical protein
MGEKIVVDETNDVRKKMKKCFTHPNPWNGQNHTGYG